MSNAHRPITPPEGSSPTHPQNSSPSMPPQHSTEAAKQPRTLPHYFRAFQSYEGKASNQELSFSVGEVLKATAFKGGWFWGHTTGWTGSQQKSGYFHPYHVKPIEPPQPVGVSAMEPRPDHILSAVPCESSLAIETSHSSDKHPTLPFLGSSHSNTEEEKKEPQADSTNIRHTSKWDIATSASMDASVANEKTHLNENGQKRPFHESSQQKEEDGKMPSAPDATKILRSRWEPPQNKRQKSDQSTSAKHPSSNTRPLTLSYSSDEKRYVSLSPAQSILKYPEQSSENIVIMAVKKDRPHLDLPLSGKESSGRSSSSNKEVNEFITPPDPTPHEQASCNSNNDKKIDNTAAETTESSKSMPAFHATLTSPQQQPSQTIVRIRIPDEQAMASRFPPGCPVLHEHTDTAGIVQSVHIQLHPPAFQSGKHDIVYTFKTEGKSTCSALGIKQPVSENELQFATRCPVLLSPSLFPKRPAGTTDYNNDDQWVNGTVVSSFKFVGDSEETYGVRLEGGLDGQSGGKIHGVARDQIRYRPPATPASTEAAVEGMDGQNQSNSTPFETSLKSTSNTPDTETMETTPSNSALSNITSSSPLMKGKKDGHSNNNNITCSITIPDTIDFDKVKTHLVGLDHSTIERMRRSLRTDIFIIGNDLSPPKDASIIGDFRRLFPVLPRNGHGQFQPCILMRGPIDRLKNTRKTITHLLVVKAYEGKDKENVRKALNNSYKECEALSDATLHSKSDYTFDGLNDSRGKKEETKINSNTKSSSQFTPIQTIPNTASGDTEQESTPATNRKLMNSLSTARPTQNRSQIASRDTGNGTSHTTTCRQFSFPGWIKYHEARACLEGQGKKNIETLYSCTINVVSKGYDAPLKKDFIVVSIGATVKNLGLAWDYITGKVLGVIKEEARGKFIYDMHLYNETSIKINKKESPVLYCRSLDAPSKKVYMYAKNYPRKGSFAKAIMGRGGANRTRALELGCDFSLHEGNIACGHYVLITGRTMESVEEAKGIVESSINGFSEQYHCEEEIYPDIDEIWADIEQIVRENEPVHLDRIKTLYHSKTGKPLKQADLGYSSMHTLIASIDTIDMKTERHSSGCHKDYFLTIKRNSELDVIRNVLRLVRENEPVELRYLKPQYRSVYNMELDHKSLGYDYLYNFVASIRSIIITKDPEDERRHFLNIKERTKGNNRQDSASTNVVSGGYSFVVDPHSTSFSS